MKRLAGLMLIAISLVLSVGDYGATVPQVQTLAVNGTNLAYIEQGQGPPLVLVHGALIDYRYWAAQVEQFSAAHRVIAVSLRHHYPNAATGDQSDYSPRVHAADVAALIRTLAVGSVHLVGHSYGGFVALLLAREHPGLVRSLVLEEPAFLSGLITTAQDKAEAQPVLDAMDTSFKETVAQLEAGNREGAIRTFLEVVIGPGTYERLPEAARGELMDNVHTLKKTLTLAPEPFTCAEAGQLGVPTLLVDGDVSPRVFPLWMNGLQPCLRTVERVTIPQASHAVHGANPVDFNRAVLEFVDRH
jgi:non-heme chloroperoxidase